MFELLLALYLFNYEAYKTQLYINYIVKTAELQGVDSFLALSLVSCESRFNPLAKGDYRSETGENMAIGLWQFWPDTWSYYSKKYNIKGIRENPFASTDLAILMLRDGYENKWYNCSKAIRNSS